MAYYQVMLEGRDFPMELENVEELMGFVTTRWVKAADEGDAELKAVNLVKEDKSLVDAVLERSGVNPMIYLVELSAVSWFTYWRRRPGCGYSFYTQ